EVADQQLMVPAGKRSLTLIAAAAALACAGLPARAQPISPDLAFEGVDGMVQILADKRLERAAKLMNGKGAMIPRNETGLSGAAGSTGMSGWIAVGGAHLASTVTDADYAGDQYNGVVGFDLAALPWLILGVS